MSTAKLWQVRVARRPWSPSRAVGFDWAMTFLCLVLLGGVYQDVWVHTHGFSDTTFFTPWHAVAECAAP
jgi:hypothetical protein